MNKRAIPALIALNVVLLLALAMVSLAPAPAQAQGFAAARYLMVSGPTTGGSQQDILYIIEMNSTKVAAATYNGSDDSWTFIDGTTMLGNLRGN